MNRSYRRGLVVLSVFAVGFAAGCGGGGGKTAYDAGVMDGAIPSGPQKIELTGCVQDYIATATAGESSGIKLIVDTGSSSTAMIGAACTTCGTGNTVYMPSPQAIISARDVSAAYDTGELGWDGSLVVDNFQLQGTGPAVSLAFAQITSQMNFFGNSGCDTPTGFVDNHYDGIIGFSKDAVLSPGTTSYEDLIVAAGVPDIFALRYCHSGGSMWLGGYSPSAITGEVSWTPLSIDPDGYFISITGFEVATPSGTTKVAGGSGGSSGQTPAMLDSGGGIMSAPVESFNALAAAIAMNTYFSTNFGDASWFVSLVTATSIPQFATKDSPAVVDAMLPPLVIDIVGGFSLTLPATQSYLSWSYDGMGGYVYAQNLFSNYFPLGDLGQRLPYVYLGDRTSLNYLTIYDRKNQRAGFATPSDTCN